MNKLLIALLAVATFNCRAQEDLKFNLGFEDQSEKKSLSDGWVQWGDYVPVIDSIAHSGSRSGKISADEKAGAFGSIAYSIPANYTGEKIKLEGLINLKEILNSLVLL